MRWIELKCLSILRTELALIRYFVMQWIFVTFEFRIKRRTALFKRKMPPKQWSAPRLHSWLVTPFFFMISYLVNGKKFFGIIGNIYLPILKQRGHNALNSNFVQHLWVFRVLVVVLINVNIITTRYWRLPDFVHYITFFIAKELECWVTNKSSFKRS